MFLDWFFLQNEFRNCSLSTSFQSLSSLFFLEAYRKRNTFCTDWMEGFRQFLFTYWLQPRTTGRSDTFSSAQLTWTLVLFQLFWQPRKLFSYPFRTARGSPFCNLFSFGWIQTISCAYFWIENKMTGLVFKVWPFFQSFFYLGAFLLKSTKISIVLT